MNRSRVIIDATTQNKGCYPLTINKPNALIVIFNVSLLEHLIYNRCQKYDDIVVVVPKEHELLFEVLATQLGCKITTDTSYLKSVDYTADGYYPKDADKPKFDIPYSWSLVSCAEQHSTDAINNVISKAATIEQGVTIKGRVSIGKGTTIKSGSYIEGDIVIGDDCTIGPNCYIRGNSSVGDRCRVGNSVELKSVIVGKDVNICHLSYLGDSIVDNDVNIGAGFISSNLRHDKQVIHTRLNGEKINTGLVKLGVVIGEGARIGVRTSTYPGRRIWCNTNILPSTIIDKDIEK